MGLGRTVAATLVGLEGHRIDIEALVSSGLVSWTVVGLPDVAVLEARDRVRAALLASGCAPPQARVTVNLSPASLPKVGSGLDLGLAVSVLAAVGEVPGSAAAVGHLGELGLDGAVRPVRGVLPLVVGLARVGVDQVVVPAANAREAALVPGVRVVAVRSLAETIAHHRGETVDGDARAAALTSSRAPSPSTTPPPGPTAATSPSPALAATPDLADVVGQPLGRRVVEVAAAGGHHVLLLGPPGAGKSMLAARLPGLLPDLDDDDALTVTAIHSVCGTLVAGGLVRRPPLESPHHTATVTAIVGGGTGLPRPGAVSRAHAGVLLLDEAPEFPRGALEALRQPLEQGDVVLHRSRGSVRLPARFLLVLTANPCPCGASGDRCSCEPVRRRRYRTRLSGPVLDRVDIRVELPPVRWSGRARDDDAESTSAVAERVRAARAAAADRWGPAQARLTAHVPGSVLRSPPYRLPRSVVGTLDRAVETGAVTGRGYDRCLRLAWTIADLSGRTAPRGTDVADALDLRVRA